MTPSRHRLLVTAMLLSPAAIVIGHALTVDPSQPKASYLSALAAHRVMGITGGLVTAVGAFLLVPVLTGVLQLVRERGLALATVGAVIAGIGGVALGAGDAMITLVMGAAVGTDRALAARLFDLGNSPLLGLPFMFAPALFLGGILLGIALLLARTVPIWQPILLIVGMVSIAAFSSGGGMAAALAHLPFGVAIAGLGVQLARLSRPVAVPVSAAAATAAPSMS